ncbi:hypothetical protein HOP50_02g11800 [Chloropicon primus]|uniref:DUF218 domain-containing protein n=1 Tax=Chloropicon primus TaxID=1764295 RepID=A0A5B8ME73_9CHLO|nr:hypothetical protein A3770_02p11950 [Chloropicon primus]UPQ97885.1 hypothetical protein HOP50_02g11800 [Chloropicon primus]|eukprot:QDZ18677.1 hypothetical protein A3770_02p11950 [Chloropicon primus]
MDISDDILKRNLSWSDSLSTGALRQRNNKFAYHPTSHRRKDRMRHHRITQQLKTVAILGSVLVCLLIFSFSFLSGGGVKSAHSKIQETLGIFRNESDDARGGTRFDRAHSPLKGLTRVIVVAGHSVLRYKDASKVEENESWYLEPYMEIPGQAKTFVDHIRMGVEAAAKDPLSILLFSGGTTKVKAGPMTEAQSYWTVAETLDWFGHQDVRHRAFTENFARDSFENLLFSLCRFNELTSDYPDRVTVISYEFKRRRFAEVHRDALRFPRGKFAFLGSQYPEAFLERASEGERKVFEKFKLDPYGVHGELKEKLYARDPFVQGARYTNSCPEMQGLMRHNGKDLYGGSLPWRAATTTTSSSSS